MSYVYTDWQTLTHSPLTVEPRLAPLSLCVSVVCLSVCLSLSLSVCLSVCLPVCLSVCLSLSLSLSQFVVMMPTDVLKK